MEHLASVVSSKRTPILGFSPNFGRNAGRCLEYVSRDGFREGENVRRERAALTVRVVRERSGASHSAKQWSADGIASVAAEISHAPPSRRLAYTSFWR
jgi:hypothetical protein